MKQMCKKKFQSACVCRNERSNPRCLTVPVKSTEPRLQTTVRQLGLKCSIQHTQGWLKLIILYMFNPRCCMRETLGKHSQWYIKSVHIKRLYVIKRIGDARCNLILNFMNPVRETSKS